MNPIATAISSCQCAFDAGYSHKRKKIRVLATFLRSILVVNPAGFRYNFQVVDSEKSPSNRHAPKQIFGARPPGTVALVVAARQQRRRLQPGVNRPVASR